MRDRTGVAQHMITCKVAAQLKIYFTRFNSIELNIQVVQEVGKGLSIASNGRQQNTLLEIAPGTTRPGTSQIFSTIHVDK